MVKPAQRDNSNSILIDFLDDAIICYFTNATRERTEGGCQEIGMKADVVLLSQEAHSWRQRRRVKNVDMSNDNVNMARQHHSRSLRHHHSNTIKHLRSVAWSKDFPGQLNKALDPVPRCGCGGKM